MNEVAIEKTMTTKELADVLGVDERTIRRTAEKLTDMNVRKVSNGGNFHICTVRRYV